MGQTVTIYAHTKGVFVGILDRFEQRVDRLVNGAFAKAFEAEVQPVEIAAAIQSELDDSAMIVGAGRTVVPNAFTIDLSAQDFDRLMAFEGPLRTELSAVIKEHVNGQRYTTLGAPSVTFNKDEFLITGVFRVTSESVNDEGAIVEDVPAAVVRKGPHVVINGYAHSLTLARTTIGRSTEADITVDDSGISRKHCEIVLGTPPVLRDLGSTNGTWVYGERITEIALQADVDIKVGNTVIQFRLK